MSRRRRKRGFGAFLTAVIMIFAVCIAGLFVINKMVRELQTDHHEEVSAEPAEPVPFQEITIEEAGLDIKYYYQLLSDEEKIVYKEIAQGVKEHQEEIYLHTEDPERANQIFRFVLYDMPEVFWCEGKAVTTGYEASEQREGYSVIKVEYIYDAAETENRKAGIDQAVSECLAGMPGDASEYERIKYVYEYIVNTVDYSLESVDNQNICSVFLNRESVCAGYARAVQYLLERSGIYVTYVTGTSTGGLSGTSAEHAWNLVRCDGEYYYVDATWGDPVFTSQETQEVLAEMDPINYDFLCCNEEELFKTHTLSGEVEMPSCTSDQYNYYVMNGMYYDMMDESAFLQAMNEVIYAKDNPVIYKFSDETLYNNARTVILEDLVKQAAQNLMEVYGMESVNYYYQEEAPLNKLTIYWIYE